MRKLNARDRKRIKRLVERTKRYFANTEPEPEPKLDYLEIKFMDRCVTTWVVWSTGDGLQRLVSPCALLAASGNDQPKDMVNLSVDELVSIDQEIVRRSEYEQELIRVEYREHMRFDLKADGFGLSETAYKEAINVLLNDIYSNLMPAVGQWRERSLERA